MTKFAVVLIVQRVIRNQPIFLFMTHLFIGTMMRRARSVTSKAIVETISVPLTRIWYGLYWKGLSGCLAFLFFAACVVCQAPPRPMPRRIFNSGPPKQADSAMTGYPSLAIVTSATRSPTELPTAKTVSPRIASEISRMTPKAFNTPTTSPATEDIHAIDMQKPKKQNKKWYLGRRLGEVAISMTPRSTREPTNELSNNLTNVLIGCSSSSAIFAQMMKAQNRGPVKI